MGVFVHLELAAIAIFAGIFLSSRVGVWGVTVYFLLRGKDAPEGTAAKLRRIAMATVLHSGPWLVAAAVLIAFYVHSKPWAVWIFGGALVGLLVYLFSVQSLLRKVRRNKRENAA